MTEPSRQEGLPCPKDAHELLDLYFLEIRSHLMEAAAGFDRIERAKGGAEALKDPRVMSLFQALREFDRTGTGRVRRFLEIMSEPGETEKD